MTEINGFKAENAFKEVLMYSGNSKSIDKWGMELYLCAKGYTPKPDVLNAVVWRIDIDGD